MPDGLAAPPPRGYTIISGLKRLDLQRGGDFMKTHAPSLVIRAATAVCALSAALGASARAAMKEKGWTPLFDGKTTTGWKNPYAWGKAEVKNREIHLTTTKKKWFLCTEKQYADFIFEVDVKMPEGKANSGFMFRCHVKKNKVFGYQAEVDPSDRKWSGGLYDEGRRRWFISPNRDHAKNRRERDKSIAEFRERAGDSFRRDDWNTYRIECVGESIKIYVNGTLCTDVKDSVDAQGYIALQHHGEKGKVYRFRNVRIKILKAADPNYKPSGGKK